MTDPQGTGRDEVEPQADETVRILPPEGHETSGTAEVTFWHDGQVSLRLLRAEGRLKVTTFDLDGASIEVIVERDW